MRDIARLSEKDKKELYEYLKNIYDAIKTTKAVYPDVIAKELIEFKEIFKDELKIEGTILD